MHVARAPSRVRSGRAGCSCLVDGVAGLLEQSGRGPKNVTATMMMMAMRATSRPYSTAEAPGSVLDRRRGKVLCMLPPDGASDHGFER